MTCWYEKTCRIRDDGCDANCARHSQMSYLFSSARVPKAMWWPKALVPDECDEAAFDRLFEIKCEAMGFVEDGGNLYIVSPVTGNGKTTWAVKIMASFFSSVWLGNNFRDRGLFVSVPELLARYSRIHSDDDSAEWVGEITELISSVDMVIWDDVGATELSKAQQNYVQGLLDARLNAGLANVFTGNMAGAPLQAAVGQRLYSRIVNSSEVITLRGRDMRGTTSGDM